MLLSFGGRVGNGLGSNISEVKIGTRNEANLTGGVWGGGGPEEN